MFEGRPHVVLASAADLINLQIFKFALVFYFVFKQGVLVFKLLNFSLCLGRQAVVLEIFHLYGFFELADLQLHKAHSLVLAIFDLCYLLHYLPLV